MNEGRKRCLVAYATRERQFVWEVDIASNATIADVLNEARRIAQNEGLPWDTAAVGIFGERCARNAVPADGDRIEIYRPLIDDPRTRRRQLAREMRRSRG